MGITMFGFLRACASSRRIAKYLFLASIVSAAAPSLAAGWDIGPGETHPALTHYGLPAGCFAQQHRVQSIVNDHDSMQAKKLPTLLTKVDVLCVGREITIDRPLLTGGGDFLAYASKVRVLAPIDTRPYFARRTEYFFVHRNDEPGRPRFASGMDEHYGDGSSWGKVLEYWWLSARDYYLRAPEALVSGGVAFSPELLGGMTPVYDGGKNAKIRPAIAPSLSSYEDLAIRSGNLTIVAESIEVAELKATPGEEASPLACNDASRVTPFLFNVSGVRGARGGFRNPLATFRPESNLPPGKGGNAGTITIVSPRSFDERTKTLIDRVSSVSGGPSGATEHVVIDSAITKHFRRGMRPSVCDFFKLSKRDPHTAAAIGVPGEKEFVVESPETAAHRVARYAYERDGFKQFEFEELAARAARDSSIASTTYGGFLASRLNQVTLEAQELIARDLRKAMLGNASQRGDQQHCENGDCQAGYVPQMFLLPNPNRSTEMTDVLTSAFQKLYTQRTRANDSAERIRQYLLHSGGLLSSPTGSYGDSSENQQLFVLLRNAEVNDLKLRSGIDGLRLEVHQIRVIVQQDILERKLAELRGSLRAMEESSGLKGLVGVLGEVGKDADAASKAYAKLKETLDTGDDVDITLAGIGFLGKLGPVAGGLSKILSLNSQDDRDLRRQVAQAEKALRQFIAQAKEERKVLDEDKKVTLEELLISRTKHAEQQSLRSLSFDYLLRRVLILYQLDRGRRSATLLQDLNSLEQYAEGRGVVRFNPVGELTRTCARHEPGSGRREYLIRGDCVHWNAAGMRRSLWGDVGGADLPHLTNVPLVVIAPNVDGIPGHALFELKPKRIAEIGNE
jgi:hypothetical protein